MIQYGDRERFAFDIGPPDPERPTTGMRQVDVYAAGRWLTCDDNTVFVPQFVGSLEVTLGRLLVDPASCNLARPYPGLSPADNHRRLLADAKAGSGEVHFAYLFMDWGPTADNVSAHLFREGEGVFIPFSFWRERHHDPGELGQVFVAELTERELLLILHQTAWHLARGRPAW